MPFGRGTRSGEEMLSKPGVVIPAWNAERFIADAIRSVLEQTLTDWNLVVVDDGSTDGTLEAARQVAAGDPRIMVVTRPNSGPAAARNTGFDAVADRSDCVLFLDADDALEPRALERLMGTLNAAPESTVGAYGMPRDMTTSGELIDIPLSEAWGYTRQSVDGWRCRRLAEDEPSGFGVFVIWPAIQTPGLVLIKTSALRAAGPWRWRSMPSEDWEMWLRLSAQGDFVVLREFTLRKRVTPDSLSSHSESLARAEPIIRTSLTADPYTREQRRLARAGELHCVLSKLSWAESALRQRRPVHAARQAIRAARSLGAFLTRLPRY